MATAGQRYKDVVLALATAHKYEQELGRLQLQKIIYLADILSLIWDVVGPKNGHYTYKNGPYDHGIQNSVDVLAFRGAVEIAKNNISTNQIVTTYRITQVGLNLANAMIREPTFAKRAELYDAIGHHINLRGWKNLKQLVYSEATYVIKQGDGLGHALNVNSLLSNDSLRIVLDFNNLVADKTQKFSRYNLVTIFFKILDNYRILLDNQKQNPNDDTSI